MNSSLNLNDEWASILTPKISADFLNSLYDNLKIEYQNYNVFPPQELIFNAYNCCKLSETKVVILGQDPYFNPLQANGLSFSVNPNIALPPSLKNIFKELVSDIGCEYPKNGDLTKWACQGVLLLNSILTVREGMPDSHKKMGWAQITDVTISELSRLKSNVVFILWGGHAQKKAKLIDSTKHLIIESSHPSPLSVYRGFYGSKPFSKTNNYLKAAGISEIVWDLN